jgi:glutathione S-transferase
MADPILYGNPFSTYTRTARMAFEEKGVPYTLEPVDHHAPEFREIHPFGKIPAMRHGDLLLYETLAITTYVDESFDGPALRPETIRGRAEMNQWISATLDYFYASMVRKLVFERLVAPMQGREPNEALVAESLPEIEYQAKVLAKALEDRPHLAGESVSLADLFLYAPLFYVNFVAEGHAIIDNAGPLAGWLARMTERASAQQTMPPVDKL